VVTEIGSQTGWLSEEVRAEHSHPIRDLLQQCLHSELDVLLPRMSPAGAAELIFIVAVTDGIGGGAVTKRIRERLSSCEHIQQAGLTVAVSYRLLQATRQIASESMGDFREKVAAKIQEVMDEEISWRMAKNGQK
jgi:hypothetical protein